jgi:hypothetical protein
VLSHGGGGDRSRRHDSSMSGRCIRAFVVKMLPDGSDHNAAMMAAATADTKCNLRRVMWRCEVGGAVGCCAYITIWSGS